MSVEMSRKKHNIPTYEPYEPNDLPFFIEKKAYQGAEGKVYPLPYTDRLNNQIADHAYDMVTLSNEYIEVELLPELGGKIHGAWQKSNGYEFIYKNTVIKPAMVGLAGPWISGGVEFNWPQHHRPTTFMPLEATLQENPDGSKTCWMGEAEPFHRMRASVGITVYPGSSIVEARAIVNNCTDTPLPFMWWNNLAVRVHSQYKACFPPDVEWGNDHDRRAVISFPVMKGVYKSARPFDYGEGTDATWFSNIKLPTSVMVMRGQSDMDFLGGYDFKADAGTVTVSDHHTSVGKKMWTWGDGPFGKAWCANLTDNGDRYIELMTGVYTDNQPDFTYIHPGEVKTFTTIWYPVRGIGEIMNANRQAALSLQLKDSKAHIGAITTSPKENCRIVLKTVSQVVYETLCSIDPDHPFVCDVAVPDGVKDTDLLLSVTTQDGESLISWQKKPVGQKTMPKAREIAPEPAAVESIEELYLHGAHLEQYKHHTYEPEDYYQEALKRDDKDLHCNAAMGRLRLNQGRFEEAERYFNKAIERLKMRNDNPADTEVLYQKGRLMRLMGRDEEAYQLFHAASWQYAWVSPSMYEAACIDCAKGNRSQAIEELQQALLYNALHVKAAVLLAYLQNDVESLKVLLKKLPQDSYVRYALWLMNAGEIPAFSSGRPEDVLDVVISFMHAGLKDEALRILNTLQKNNQLTEAYRAKLTGNPLQEGEMLHCFPNRLDDISILSSFPESAACCYLLGCLYYDRKNYKAARASWENCLNLRETCAFAHRNLAQALFDHFDEKQLAGEHLKRAQELAPENARIVYELSQYYKNMNVSVKERLAYLRSHQDQAFRRDDCFLDEIVLVFRSGDYEKAREMLLSKRFNIYEGGEGRLTKMHGWLYTLWGQKERLAGNTEQARKWFSEALVYPENYGEGRHYSAQEANIYYYTGLLLADLGLTEEAEEAWQKAANQPKQITEITYFAALACKKLRLEQSAMEKLNSMVAAGERLIENAHIYGYYGVGMAAPLPYEQNIVRINTAEGLLLKTLGLLGKGETQKAQETLKELKALDPWNEKLSFFEILGIL